MIRLRDLQAEAERLVASDLCQWFIRCLNPATTTVPHPVLGDVPTCQACHTFAARFTPSEVAEPAAS